tara:strand:- start:116 stop:817 length:702 start_codon:yes stop_codon:yes gene_type:complete
MTNIIFDIWTDYSDYNQPKHISKQWLAYKDILIEKHKKYAKLCGSEYRHYDIKHKNKINFITLNFLKIYIAEDLAQKYDKVLYLDLDVIPKTQMNFFEHHDFSKFLCHRTLAPRWKINRKRLMLESEGISSEHNVINTGVFGITKEICNLIQFQKREKEINLNYPEWVPDKESQQAPYRAPNNEIYLSYIVEKYNVPYTDIGKAWNFLVDESHPKSDACHFLHMSTKEFSSVL